MFYPIVLHKEKRSAFGVTVPDLPGCFSAGDTFEDALNNACEAIELHIEGLLEDGETVPMPTSINRHQKKTEFGGGVWALVPVDMSKLTGRAVRINVTMPERVLRAVDSYASEHGETRSSFLARAAMQAIAGI